MNQNCIEGLDCTKTIYRSFPSLHWPTWGLEFFGTICASDTISQMPSDKSAVWHGAGTVCLIFIFKSTCLFIWVFWVSGEGDGTPLQYSCLENPMDGGAWWAAVPQGRVESDTTEQLHFHFSLSCIGEGNGNPLQCSCRRLFWPQIILSSSSGFWCFCQSTYQPTLRLSTLVVISLLGEVL